MHPGQYSVPPAFRSAARVLKHPQRQIRIQVPAKPNMVTGQPEVISVRPRPAWAPSTICPLTPQHRGPQPDEVTHAGKKKTPRIAAYLQSAGRFAGDGFEPSARWVDRHPCRTSRPYMAVRQTAQKSSGSTR